MMKLWRLVLTTAALLVTPLATAQEQEVVVVKRARALRFHSQKRHYSHHKAIQDKYAQEQNLYTVVGSDDYTIHVPKYLDDSITSRPFINCVPESFHENNMYGKNGHHHDFAGYEDDLVGYGDEGYLDAYGGRSDGGYYSKSSKGAKGKGKGKGGGAEIRYGKSKSKSKSKSKGGYYYRQRILGGRPGRTNGRVAHKRNGGGRNNPYQRGKPTGRQGQPTETVIPTMAPAAAKTVVPIYDAMVAADDEYYSEPPLNGQNHHEHPHTHSNYMGLPLCNDLVPIRRTYGPVPTIAPRWPTASPIPTTPGAKPTTAAPGAKPTTTAPGPRTTAPSAQAETAMDEGATPAPDPNAPAGTVPVKVEAFLEFGFFDDSTPREPTQADVDSLLVRTSEWYTEQLRMTFPNLNSFQATFVSTMTDLSADSPIRVDFDANAYFPEGADVPDTAALFTAMEGLDYQAYITDAVWSGDMSGGPFDDIQQAGFNARVGR